MTTDEKRLASYARLRLSGHFEAVLDRAPAALHPLDDMEVAQSVADAANLADPGADALDLGAALVLVAGLRRRLERLEADLVDAVVAGLGWEVVAATTGAPVEEAKRRQSELRAGVPGPVAPAGAAES
jgi:hypothetical protein